MTPPSNLEEAVINLELAKALDLIHGS